MENRELEKVKRKLSKGKIIGIIVGVITVFILISFISSDIRFSNAMKQAESYMQTKNYEKAIDTYKLALDIKSSDEITSKISKAETLKFSAEAYKYAQYCFNSKSYTLAIDKFKLVSKDDKDNYIDAETKIKLSVKLNTLKSIQDAKDYASKRLFDNAHNAIVRAITYDSNNKQLTVLESKYMKQAKAESVRLQAIEKAKAKAEAIAEEKRLKAEAKAEKARKKREGVSIGMTMQDVLDSCWGKPNDINRTTTAYGTSEQWCYDNYNYLYFEDGILTDIQN